ncbi:MAG TPA: DUF2634 domain-containing protein [Armatimonadota bacterium]|nr:DUF2634 domain-containing protein [Armatimonadota bacterium]
MIPESIDFNNVIEDGAYTIQPSKTYKLDLVSKHIIGTIDGRDAVLQAVRKILDTDRYAYEIYDGSYGHELVKLVGKDFNYIKARLPQIVEEALTQDERITGISNMNIRRISIDEVEISFIVNTIYGDVPYSKEVRI